MIQSKPRKTAVNHVLVILAWLILTISGLTLFINENANVIEKNSALINEAGKIRGGAQRIIKIHLSGKPVAMYLPEIEQSIDILFAHTRSANSFYGSYDEQYFTATLGSWEVLVRLIEQDAPQDEILEQSEIIWYSSNALVAHIEHQTLAYTKRFNLVTAIFFTIVLVLLFVFFVTKHVIRDKIEYGSTHDLLTGLYNRYYFQEALEQNYASSKRTGQGFALLMCDIDHFKIINDSRGHPAGDRILHELGMLLRSVTRTMDTAVRYGGEEFAILMTTNTTAECEKYAERIRHTVENHRFRGNIPVTISIGFCLYRSGMKREQIIENADKALYHAKEAGRNCVIDFDSLTV